MKKVFLLFFTLLAFSVQSQTTVPQSSKLAITKNIKQNNATRIVVQDSITKELNWILKSTLTQPTPTIDQVLGAGNSTIKNLTVNNVAGNFIYARAFEFINSGPKTISATGAGNRYLKFSGSNLLSDIPYYFNFNDPTFIADNFMIGSVLGVEKFRITKEGRMVITDGVANNEAVTVGQLDAATSGGGSQTFQQVSDTGGFTNGSTIRQGIHDEGTGGNGGIEFVCSAGYPLKWEGGALYSKETDGVTNRPLFLRNTTLNVSNGGDGVLFGEGYISGSRGGIYSGNGDQAIADFDTSSSEYNYANGAIKSTPTVALDVKGLFKAQQGVYDGIDNFSSLITSDYGFRYDGISGTNGDNFGSSHFYSNPEEGFHSIVRNADDSQITSIDQGRVQIDINSPQTNINGDLKVRVADNSLSAFSVYDSANDNTPFNIDTVNQDIIIDYAYNLGIGRSPDYNLDVNGNINVETGVNDGVYNYSKLSTNDFGFYYQGTNGSYSDNFGKAGFYIDSEGGFFSEQTSNDNLYSSAILQTKYNIVNTVRDNDSSTFSSMRQEANGIYIDETPTVIASNTDYFYPLRVSNVGIYPAINATGSDFGIVASGGDTAIEATGSVGLKTYATDYGVVADGNTAILANGNTYGIEAYSEETAVYAYGYNVGVIANSETDVAGIFNILSTNTENIVDFRKNNVVLAAIQNDGKITATAGTEPTDVVVKSQLDAVVASISIPTLQQVTTSGANTTKPINISVSDDTALQVYSNESGIYSAAYYYGVLGTSATGIGVQGLSIGSGLGLLGESSTGVAGRFKTGVSGTANIVEFQKNNTNVAVIQSTGKITATAGTASTDVAVISQLGVSGTKTATGTATTTFTVTIGSTQPNNTYKVVATPSNVLSSALFYITNKTTTTFDVVYLTGLTGAVAFDWILKN